MQPRTLSAGTATAIGSLPHVDARSAAALVLRCLPELPAAPQLPLRSVREQIVPQWAAALPEIRIAPDGELTFDPSVDPDAPLATTFVTEGHSGLLGFLELAALQPKVPSHVKVQVCGPLTLGLALARAGMPAERAFQRALDATRAWVRAVERLVDDHLPGVQAMVWLDEPGLVAWRDGEPPFDRESATDLLSGALAQVRGTSGVHVCGSGDARVALDAGPDVIGVEVNPRLIEQAGWVARHLEGGGWVAWGAVPTDRPVGEQATPLWKALVELWCELTRRGCDPLALRSQALVTPACGLAGHGLSQAERALRLAREIGARVHDQAAATKLTVGA